MKKFVCIVCVATLLFTACLFPASAQSKDDAGIEAPMETEPVTAVALGDVNGDGAVDAADALRMLRHAVGKEVLAEEALAAGLLNEDGAVNATDALLCLQFAVGKRDVFPVLPAGPRNTFVVQKRAQNGYPNWSEWDAAFDEVADRLRQGAAVTVQRTEADDTMDLGPKAPTVLYEMDLATCRKMARAGWLADLSRSATLCGDLLQTAATRSVTVNGKVYGVGADDGSGMTYCLCYNMDMLKQYATPEAVRQTGQQMAVDAALTDALAAAVQQPDPVAQLAEDGLWNYDAFRVLAKVCTVDTDGDNRTDVYGLTGNTVYGCAQVFCATGGVITEQNGRPTVTGLNEQAAQAAKHSRNLMKDRSQSYAAATYTDNWRNRKAVFVCAATYYVPAFTDGLAFQWHVAPLPRRPGSETNASCAFGGMVWALHKVQADRVNEAGSLLNHLAAAPYVTGAKNRQSLPASAAAACRGAARGLLPDYASGVMSNSAMQSLSNLMYTSPVKVSMDELRRQLEAECEAFYARFFF